MEEVVNQEVVTESPAPAEVVTEAAPVVTKPGEKTDPALLLKSLQEEKAKRRQLEADLAEARARVPAEQVAFSEEGKSILTVVNSVKTELEQTKEQLAMERLIAANPQLKDKQAEFEEFRLNPENAGMSLQTAAKAFIVEKDLIEKPVQRKGLEPATGGGRTVPQQGMTPEEIDRLRVENYREYAKRIRNGTLK